MVTHTWVQACNPISLGCAPYDPQTGANNMLRSFGAALAVTLAIAPFEFSVLQLTQNDAEAAATFKSALLMPAVSVTFVNLPLPSLRYSLSGTGWYARGLQ